MLVLKRYPRENENDTLYSEVLEKTEFDSTGYSWLKTHLFLCDGEDVEEWVPTSELNYYKEKEYV